MSEKQPKKPKKPLGNPLIAEYGKSTRFKKGQSGNPQGRPRKLVKCIRAELFKLGYQEAADADVISILRVLINLTVEDLQKLVEDDRVAFVVRIIARSLLSRDGYRTLQDIFDRAYGRPRQVVHASVDSSVSITDSEILDVVSKLNANWRRD